MLLAVDVGNTNLTVGVFAGERLVRQWRLESDSRRSSSWYARALRCPFRKVGELPKAAVYGSVVPPLDKTLEKAIASAFGLKAVAVGPKSPLGLRLKVKTPEQVGADRVLNAVALRAMHKTPAVAVDFGTATTFDCVDKNGDYIGGAILLGPNSAARALHEFTAQLPLIEVQDPGTAIGKDTVHCLEAGLYYGYLGMIKEVLARTKKEMGGQVHVVATGGLSALFADELGVERVPDLTLHGLRIAHGILQNRSR